MSKKIGSADADGLASSGHAAGPSRRGHFFAVDRRTWALVCKTDINVMTAYLVLARGSGRDQRTTAWSVRAIEVYTGIGRPRAERAIEALVRAGLVQITHKGTKPRYRIVPAHEVPGCEGYPPPKLDADEQVLFDRLVAGKTWVPGSADRDWPSYRKPRAVAAKLVEKGAARVAGPHQQNHYLPIVYDAEAAAKPDWIWQPNTIIDGASGETAPVELVRQTQSAATLRLFIELYHAHALARDGGVDRRGIWQTFTRQTVGQRGPFIVYGFQQGKCWANGDAPFVRPFMTGERETIAGCDRTSDRGWPVFWGAWNRLVRLGLTEIVWHLVEANNDTAEIIHPYAIGNGEAPEQRLADAAHAAGEAMLTDGQRASAEASGLRLAPVLAHITEVQMVGIARLRYRPRTGATAAWFARMAEWDELAARYDEMATEARRDG